MENSVTSKKKIIQNVLFILTWCLSISLYMAFNYIPVIGSIIIAMNAAALVMNGKKQPFQELIPAGAMFVCLITGMISKRYSVRMAMVTISALCALCNVVKFTIEKRKAGKHQFPGIILGIAGYGLSGLICLLLFINVIHPDGMTVYRDVIYESS